MSTAPAQLGPVERARLAQRTPRVRRLQRLEGLAVFLIFGLAYFAIGYQVVTQEHVVVFDAMDRLTRAYMVWWNEPPKLAAVGFAFPPLTTVALIPYTLVKPLATSLIALPAMSATFMGATMMMLNKIFVRCGLDRPFRWILLLAVGLNPLVVYYGGNGMSEPVHLLLLMGGIHGFIAWYQTQEPKYIIFSGMLLTLAMLTRYSVIAIAFALAVIIGVALARRQVTRATIEGSVIAYAAPVAYGLALWILFNAVIVGEPFGWLELTSDDDFAVNSVGEEAGENVTPASVGEQLVELIGQVAPLAAVLIPVLVSVFVAKKDDMALWLAVLIAIPIVVIAANAFIADDLGLVRMRDALPVMFLGVVAAAWLCHTLGEGNLVVWGLTVAALVVTIPLTWLAMEDYKFQAQEQAFTRALNGFDDQEGTESIGGFQVGIEPERAMARYIKRNVGGRDAILTDNAQTFGVILLTGRPDHFFDRIDKGDSRWREVVADPIGRVRYLLMAARPGQTGTPGDLIARRYPEAAQRRDDRFRTVYATSRYVLVEVPRSRRAAAPPATPAPAPDPTAPADGAPGLGHDPTAPTDGR